VDILVLLVLMVVNGLFAMAEMAIITARPSRLQQLASDGKHGAKVAMQLANEPNHFLSTVQVGITLIGILTGTLGGAALAEDLEGQIEKIKGLDAYSNAIAFALIVSITTYLSLVIGELVPKRLAMQNPEGLATRLAVSMNWLSIATRPIVALLSFSTNAVLRALGIDLNKEKDVTEAEVIALMEHGFQTGVFESAEQELVERIFELDIRTVGSVMTPRTEITWLNLEEPADSLRAKIAQNPYSVYPVCQGDLDRVVGMVSAKQLMAKALLSQDLPLKEMLKEPLLLPETIFVSKALELIKSSGIHVALIISEYGGVEGIVTINDVLEELVGNIDVDEPQFVQRADGTWLVDGMLGIHKVVDVFPDFQSPGDEEGSYTTLAGFIMARLGHIPTIAETFVWGDFTFEIVDMDGRRIDKVMISPADPNTESEADSTSI
jgi:putative hemolysin